MAQTSNYSQIRFIGYAIPTTPANLISLDAGSVAGTYLGNLDIHEDIVARVAVMKNAVEIAANALPENEDPGSVLNVFLAPEFFFHGLQGPYVYGSNYPDPVAEILRQLQATFPASEYSNWTFVFGTAMTSQVANFHRVCAEPMIIERNAHVRRLAVDWKAAQGSFGPRKSYLQDLLNFAIADGHASPVVEVRDRALVVSNVPLDTFQAGTNGNNMTTEKYFVSNEDFILYEALGQPNVVTEQMVAYQWIDLSDGDLKQAPYDPYAIFRQTYGADNVPRSLDLGVEICLDHYDGRLRKNIDHEPFPLPTDRLHVQLVPSCGMQIQLPSVAAGANGFVFNCDGEYSIDNTAGVQQGTLSGVECIYASYVDSANSDYGAHTQLARVQTPAVGGNPSESQSKSATFLSLNPTGVQVLPVPAVDNLSHYFAGGPGEIHSYGPFALYPNEDGAVEKGGS